LSEGQILETPTSSETPDEFNFDSETPYGDEDPRSDDDEEESKKDNILIPKKPRTISNGVGNIRSTNERFLVLFN
jgi:hypothetical protein